MKTINDYTNLIEKWSEEKGLHKASPSRQMLKVIEEVGETAAAMARNDSAKITDGIGDIFVTIVILAQQHGYTIDECIAKAWKEIENRTGEMRDGVFIKSEDLQG